MFAGSAFDIPRTMSSVMCSVNKRIESSDATIKIVVCFMDATSVAAGARPNNRVATKGGFVRTNGGYICLNRCT